MHTILSQKVYRGCIFLLFCRLLHIAVSVCVFMFSQSARFELKLHFNMAFPFKTTKEGNIVVTLGERTVF